jgi:hypothetical protein
VNCDGSIFVDQQSIKIVDSFRYLGLLMKADCVDPTSILVDRIHKC